MIMVMMANPTKKPSTAIAPTVTGLADSATVSVRTMAARYRRVPVLYYPSSVVVPEYSKLVAEMTSFLAFSCNPQIDIVSFQQQRQI